MAEVSQHDTIIYTDHRAALGITKQVTFSTTSTDNFNFRLVRVSDYVQRFRLDIKHKPGKLHIIPDVLSRLATTNENPTMKQKKGKLNALFIITLIELQDDFKQRFSNGVTGWIRS